MQLSMKVSFTVLTIVATGLLILAASCQQTNKGESKSSWQLKSPPGTAAGYGTSPVDTKEQKEIPSATPANDSGQEEVTPTASEPPSKQTAREGHEPTSSTPAVKVEPPPSAAGYGNPPQDSRAQKETPTLSPAKNPGHGETTPTASGPPSKQTATESGEASPSTSSWKIIPPPSAAGYGK